SVLTPTPTTDIYSLSLHDALPICRCLGPGVRPRLRRRAQECRRGGGGREEPVRPAVVASAERRPGMTVLLYIIGIVLFLIGISKDRKSTRLNSSHVSISYAVFCLK